MNTYPKALGHFFPNLIYAAAIPLGFIIALLYEPAPLCRLLHMGEDLPGIRNIFSFNISIVFAICLLTMIAFRLAFYFLRRTLPMTIGRYALWCLAEAVTVCAFTAMYLTLMGRGAAGYLWTFSRTLASLGTLLLLPYLMLTLWFCYDEARKAKNAPQEGARLKFYDNRHQLKFITEAASVLYIESNENYIIIHYLDNNVPRRFQLRNSMKSVETLCEQAGFARTHRCYIVNPGHVKLIRKDENGQNYAELGYGIEGGIPVSKKYYESIASIL